MTPLRIAYNDLAKLQSVTALTEAVGYPASNAVHPHLSRAWRSTSVATQWVKFDAGVGNTIDFDTAILVGHNLTAAAIVKVQTDDTDSWAPPGGMDKSGDPTQSIIFVSLSPSPTARRYARVYIDDPTNGVGYLSVGRVFLCVRFDAEEAIGPGFQVSTEDSTLVSRSLTGQAFADLGVLSTIYSMSMATMKNATKVALLAICRAVGQYDPVVVFPSDGIDPLYATMTKLTKFTEQGGWGWVDDSLIFREAH